jgi:predicted alpha/beta superfamily hydrolase
MAMNRHFATNLQLKNIFKLIFIVIFFSPSAQSQAFKLYQEAFKSKFLRYPRSIYVYTPPVALKKNKLLPVLYFHDGQNLYDPARSVFGQTWQLEKTLNDLIKNKVIPPVIVVGIDNSPDRILEYTFSRDLQGRGGGAQYYCNFLVQELIPEIEKNFPVSTDRSLIGSSLGGLVSIYAGITHYKTFKRIAALSPSLWWDRLKILQLLTKSKNFSPILYADSGTEGGERPMDVLELEKVIQTHFAQSVRFQKIISRGDTHNEVSWAKRIPLALEFLFGHYKD